MGSAKLQRTEHTFTHHYDFSQLFIQYNTLNNHFSSLKTIFSNNSFYLSKVSNYDKAINFIRASIENKFSSIDVHAIRNNRVKRGLFNAVGSAIGILTGNMDATDNERITKILEHMKTNQINLQEQLKNQYSVNYKIIKQFNDTLKNIEYNELELKSRILQLQNLLNENIQHTQVLFVKDIYNQFVILYNTILTVLTDIENSLTFCKLGTMHPSIITPNNLFFELRRISSHYHNQLPFELKVENIIEFESIIEIHCQVETDRINYFLSIPINYESKFELFYLLPIPTKHGSTFLTIITNSKYFLQSEQNAILPLRESCTKGKFYQCQAKLLANFQPKCEEEIIKNGSTNHCRYSQVTIAESHMERIPAINHYLAVFPSEEIVKIKCQQQEERRYLTGIYLIHGSPCKVYFKEKEVTFEDNSYGKPLIVNNFHFNKEKLNLSNFTIDLKALRLKDISFNEITPVVQFPTDFHKPSVWTILLYLGAAAIATYLLIRWRKARNLTKPEPSRPSETEPREETKITLPGDAPF